MAPKSMDELCALDKADPLSWTRAEFELPLTKECGGEGEGEAIYFCGNSLGLLSKRARALVVEEMDVWSKRVVTGHFDHPLSRPWKHVDAPLTPHLARLVGAQESEVAHSSTLTSNIHNLFCSFYRPTKRRWKIVIETGSFPSDWRTWRQVVRELIEQYAIHSHPKLHEDVLSPEQVENAIIPLTPRKGEETLRTEDILATLEQHKDEIAIVWLPLVQYYTGQLYDIPPISETTHRIGALLGLDMAHGIGNVPCKLNEWNVDFAVWCTYKYLNAGPSAIGGYYIKDGLDDGGRRLAGWWGNESQTRFQMAPQFRPTPGAKGYQHSCTPVLSSIPLLATLELIDKAGFDAMRRKAIELTNTLEELLRSSKFFIPGTSTAIVKGVDPHFSAVGNETRESQVGFKILTPAAPWRGTQLSLFITPHLANDGAGRGVMPRLFHRMLKRGLVGDEREPSVIRLSPVVLYNTFEEVGQAARILEESLEEEAEWVKAHPELANGHEAHGEDGKGAERDLI